MAITQLSHSNLQRPSVILDLTCHHQDPDSGRWFCYRLVVFTAHTEPPDTLVGGSDVSDINPVDAIDTSLLLLWPVTVSTTLTDAPDCLLSILPPASVASSLVVHWSRVTIVVRVEVIILTVTSAITTIKIA